VLREHGHANAERIHLAILEAKGAISVLTADLYESGKAAGRQSLSHTRQR
jgi:uncharacterized membrane protein YcaP (DUF421 family)